MGGFFQDMSYTHTHTHTPNSECQVSFSPLSKKKISQNVLYLDIGKICGLRLSSTFSNTEEFQ